MPSNTHLANLDNDLALGGGGPDNFKSNATEMKGAAASRPLA